MGLLLKRDKKEVVGKRTLIVSEKHSKERQYKIIISIVPGKMAQWFVGKTEYINALFALRKKGEYTVIIILGSNDEKEGSNDMLIVPKRGEPLSQIVVEELKIGQSKFVKSD